MSTDMALASARPLLSSCHFEHGEKSVRIFAMKLHDDWNIDLTAPWLYFTVGIAGGVYAILSSISADNSMQFVVHADAGIRCVNDDQSRHDQRIVQ